LSGCFAARLWKEDVVLSVDRRGVRGSETDEARDRAGLGGAVDMAETARVVDERRRGSKGGGGTRDHPKSEARIAGSDNADSSSVVEGWAISSLYDERS